MEGGESHHEYRGLTYRQCPPHHAVISADTLAGSQRVGGRFNPASEFGALYVALDRATAIAELRRAAQREALPLEQFLPRAMLTLEVELRNVLDLTDDAVRQSWGLTREALSSGDWQACQALGRRARQLGYEAIRFPSATGSGENLAIFLDRLAAPSNLVVVHSEELDVSRA